MTTTHSIDLYIDEQPHVIAACLDLPTRTLAWPRASSGALLLVGSGSSLNALTVAAPVFRQAGPTEVLGPRAFLRDFAVASAAGTHVIVLSQTGTSTTSIEAAARAHAAGLPTLVLTAAARSPIAGLGAPMVIMPIGDEPVGPKTKGYTGSVAALLALAAGLAAAPPPRFDRGAFAALIVRCRAAAEQFAQELDTVDSILVGGEDRQLGNAFEGSLKLSEMAGVPSAAFPTEEILHGRLHGLTPRSLGLLIVSNPSERTAALSAATAMAARGARVRIVNLSGEPSPFDWPDGLGAGPSGFEAADAILPFQSLAVALAKRRGLAPHAMKYPGLSQALHIKSGTAK